MRMDRAEGLPAPRRQTLARSPERSSRAIAELVLGILRKDLQNFFPWAEIEAPGSGARPTRSVPRFRLHATEDERSTVVELFGQRLRLVAPEGRIWTGRERRLIRALGAVITVRFHHLYQARNPMRLDYFSGVSDDHHIAAFLEPGAYNPTRPRLSWIPAILQTLRLAALSTEENRRVTSGVLLLGRHAAGPVVPREALHYNMELTALRSIYRLCDGHRTVFVVDPEGRLTGIVDLTEGWLGAASEAYPPCARVYAPHARATVEDGSICLVLCPHQEIKLFAEGMHAFTFAHGRWRMQDLAARQASFEGAVGSGSLARAVFQSALDLSEHRRGALFVFLPEPEAAIGRLLMREDVLEAPAERSGAPAACVVAESLSKRSLHYLVRGRTVQDLAPAVLEALASIDGAVVMDTQGRILAFGAILRTDPSASGLPRGVEGARTTAAYAASRYGPVLKVSEDGTLSYFEGGRRLWDE